jgi:hypothetical protein
MVDIDNWLVAHEPSRNVVQTIRVIIVCVGLIVVVPSVLEWTGFFPAVLETLSSAENEESQSSTARMVSTATVVASGVLLFAAAARRVLHWLDSDYCQGLLGERVDDRECCARREGPDCCVDRDGPIAHICWKPVDIRSDHESTFDDVVVASQAAATDGRESTFRLTGAQRRRRG